VIAGRLVNAVERLLTTLSSHASSLSKKQLLVLIVGVITGQTLVQSRKFGQLGYRYQNVSEPPTSRADGGEHVPSEERAERLGPLGNGTTGGGLVGGAIAGAGIGSSWGTGGVVGSAIFGAVLGDVFESLANVD
jgi:hypothetical protein